MRIPNPKVLAFGLVLAPAIATAEEARLTLCPTDSAHPTGPGLHLENGRTLSVDYKDTALPPGCLGAAIGHHKVRNVALVGPETNSPATGLVLVEVQRGHGNPSGNVEVRASRPEMPPDIPAALTVGSGLLPRLVYRRFGEEERVLVRRRGEYLEVACRAGSKPAGIVLNPGDARMPRGLAASLIARGSGHSGFRFAIVAKGKDAPQDAEVLQPAGSRMEAVIRAEAWHGSTEAVEFVLLCPAQAATLTLESVAIELRHQRSDPAPRSAWMWETARWADDPERLVQDAVAHDIRTLLVALRIEDGRLLESERLANFVRLAGKRGISVVAVEGDPAMVLEKGRKAAVSRGKAIARYQRTVTADAQLAGVQYDIEPYLLPSFERERETILAAWADTVAALRAALGERIDLVLPFWIADRPDARHLLLDRLEPHVQRITIMAYRTQADTVTSAAEPLLAWGSELGIPVTVGLEAGIVADEVHRHYVPATQGDLHLVGIGDITAAILLEGIHEGLPGSAFRLDRTVRIPGSRISFLGDVGRMMEVARQTEGRLTAWSAFSGLAFHGLFDR